MAASSNSSCSAPNQMQLGQGQPLAEVKLLLAPKPVMYPHLSQPQGLPGVEGQCLKPDPGHLFWVKPEGPECSGQTQQTGVNQHAQNQSSHLKKKSSCKKEPFGGKGSGLGMCVSVISI
ncbi:Protein of unknown function [Gryllus bimaculatus]|nr:Protein of unknown function [Gryllus bimaculatus]